MGNSARGKAEGAPPGPSPRRPWGKLVAPGDDGAILRTLADAEKALETIRPEESLWQPGAGERGLTSATFYQRFRKYLRAAGLAPSGVHVLRHTAPKLRRDVGQTVEEVSAFLGHPWLAVTVCRVG